MSVRVWQTSDFLLSSQERRPRLCDHSLEVPDGCLPCSLLFIIYFRSNKRKAACLKNREGQHLCSGRRRFVGMIPTEGAEIRSNIDRALNSPRRHLFSQIFIGCNLLFTNLLFSSVSVLQGFTQVKQTKNYELYKWMLIHDCVDRQCR